MLSLTSGDYILIVNNDRWYLENVNNLTEYITLEDMYIGSSNHEIDLFKVSGNVIYILTNKKVLMNCYIDYEYDKNLESVLTSSNNSKYKFQILAESVKVISIQKNHIVFESMKKRCYYYSDFEMNKNYHIDSKPFILQKPLLTEKMNVNKTNTRIYYNTIINSQYSLIENDDLCLLKRIDNYIFIGDDFPDKMYRFKYPNMTKVIFSDDLMLSICDRTYSLSNNSLKLMHEYNKYRTKYYEKGKFMKYIFYWKQEDKINIGWDDNVIFRKSIASMNIINISGVYCDNPEDDKKNYYVSYESHHSPKIMVINNVAFINNHEDLILDIRDSYECLITETNEKYHYYSMIKNNNDIFGEIINVTPNSKFSLYRHEIKFRISGDFILLDSYFGIYSEHDIHLINNKTFQKIIFERSISIEQDLICKTNIYYDENDVKYYIDIDINGDNYLEYILCLFTVNKNQRQFYINIMKNNNTISTGSGPTRHILDSAVSEFFDKYVENGAFTNKISKLSDNMCYSVGLMIHYYVLYMKTGLPNNLPNALLVALLKRSLNRIELEYLLKMHKPDVYVHVKDYDMTELGFKTYKGGLKHYLNIDDSYEDKISFIVKGINHISDIKNLNIMNVATLQFYFTEKIENRQQFINKLNISSELRNNIDHDIIYNIILKMSDEKFGNFMKNVWGSKNINLDCKIVISDVKNCYDIKFATCSKTIILSTKLFELDDRDNIIENLMTTSYNVLRA